MNNFHNMQTSDEGTVLLRAAGTTIHAPALHIADSIVAVTGKRITIASVYGEYWQSGNIIKNPSAIIGAIRNSQLNPDLFSFSQKFWDFKPRYPYTFTWDNIAAIPIISYEHWLEKQVSHDLRKDLKRAAKRGVVVRMTEFDDTLVAGIKDIYDETPIRQGRRFWHYRKDVEVVKQENSSYLDRSTFIGAFHNDELVGFIKYVLVDDVAQMMQIIAKEKHQDKRPMNALISKALEVAHGQGCSYLTYGKYVYDNRVNSSVTQFKRRNGFKEIRFPKYYIPLNWKGKLVLALGLHQGFKRFIPEQVHALMSQVRASLLSRSNTA